MALRCDVCGMVLKKKDGKKAPKYCDPCRKEKQEEFKKRSK